MYSVQLCLLALFVLETDSVWQENVCMFGLLCSVYFVCQVTWYWNWIIMQFRNFFLFQSINPLIAKKMTEDRGRDYMNARRVAKEYEAVTRGLNRNNPSVPPQNTPEEVKQVRLIGCQLTCPSVYTAGVESSHVIFPTLNKKNIHAL